MLHSEPVWGNGTTEYALNTPRRGNGATTIPILNNPYRGRLLIYSFIRVSRYVRCRYALDALLNAPHQQTKHALPTSDAFVCPIDPDVPAPGNICDAS